VNPSPVTVVRSGAPCQPARANIERYASSGRLDLDYLSTLGPDATPVIVESLPPDLARCVLASTTDPGTDDWLGWNLGRARAAAVAGDLSDPPRPQDCPRELGG
jgi:two-component system, OmpR family, sensor histidine kinase BaeS